MTILGSQEELGSLIETKFDVQRDHLAVMGLYNNIISKLTLNVLKTLVQNIFLKMTKF